jgi:hypothetical protein
VERKTMDSVVPLVVIAVMLIALVVIGFESR